MLTGPTIRAITEVRIDGVEAVAPSESTLATLIVARERRALVDFGGTISGSTETQGT
jgi:hypothetical protein